MKVLETEIEAIKILEPKAYQDNRGYFFESYNDRVLEKIIGKKVNFVQDNNSRSRKGVLRGFHYQLPPYAQAKLVRVVEGVVFDVAVDIRRSSPTFGKWIGVYLSSENRRQLWIPEGFAHAFLTLSDHAEFLYKTTNYWSQESERTILWDDSELAVRWPIVDTFIISDKDRQGSSFSAAEVFA